MTFEGHDCAVLGVCKINNHKFVSASADKTLKLWRISEPNAVTTFKGHMNDVYGVCKIDETTFVSASKDRTLKLWKHEMRMKLVQGENIIGGVYEEVWYEEDV